MKCPGLPKLQISVAHDRKPFIEKILGIHGDSRGDLNLDEIGSAMLATRTFPETSALVAYSCLIN